MSLATKHAPDKMPVMKKQAGKKLALSTETLRTVSNPDDLVKVVGGLTTAITCGCSVVRCTTAPECGVTRICTL
jgi:hypothetical protein